MTAPTFRGQTSFVRQFIAGVTAAAGTVDSAIGSITLAFAQAVTAVALWLQAAIAQVLLLTRAATSTGSDLDSWMADWNFIRLPAVAATTTETFSRATPTAQAVVPIGQLIQTGPAGLQYQVTLDTANAAYNAALDGYVLAVNVSSVTVPIQAVLAGAENGNVLANTITSFVSPIPGVDTCTNPSNVTNGLDAEPDTAFRARFVLYLGSLSSADEDAIASAIANVQQGIFYELVENYDYPGTTPDNGNFFVVIDDGTGNPPTSLITLVQNAINAIRGFTIRYTVNGPTVVVPPIVLAVRVASGYSSASVQGAVQAAIVAGVNAVELGAGTLFVSQVAAFALAVPGVVSVEPNNTTINGVQADYALTAPEIPRIAAANVTVNTY